MWKVVGSEGSEGIVESAERTGDRRLVGWLGGLGISES